MAKTYKGKSTRPGGGGRFQKCVDDARAGGARDPEAACAQAGRAKYGKAKMAQWSAAGRKRAKRGK